MKKVIVLCCVAGAFVACSGAGGQQVLDPPPVTNTHPNYPDAAVDANKADSDVEDAGIDTCVSENDATFCSRYQSACGAVIGLDNCNTTRTVAICGGCKATEFCNAGVCSTLPCVPATDASLCVTAVKDCGVVSLVDNCGVIKNAVCGPSDCGKGFLCTANKCTVCAAKTCAVGACGLMSDGCNPTPLDCGTCSGVNTCIANVCTPPACVPETNTAFCSRTVSNCGTKTAADNCGATRTVSSCGTLTFNGISGMSMSGGVPSELAASATKYIEAWINPSSATASIVQVGSSPGTGRVFSLGLISGNLAIIGSTVSLPGNTTIPIPLNTWTFVYAGISGGTGYLGKIVNNIRTEQIMKTDVGGTALLTGDSVVIGSSFVGQMNQIRLWSTIPDTANYHDCIATEAGLLRQWCFREGSGTLTSDNVTATSSTVVGASWTTGACQ